MSPDDENGRSRDVPIDDELLHDLLDDISFEDWGQDR